MIGQTLGHYRIDAKLGAGGMGVVYRATDTTLGRDVAIKVLAEAFARDPERLARFEREARVLAQLNHPNIAAIYGFENVGGVPFLVLECVPGETLAERIARGPLQVEEGVRICTPLAEALEAAHEKGIVHRDLKPANIKITPEGKVKVLDFGLAKAFAEEPSGDPEHSPTLSIAATHAGTILGTAAYMSPEQARGRPIDKRTDIWAFGCVLYEMLTGRKAFAADNLTDTIAAVVKSDPDWSKLPLDAPLRLLRRCLEKDPRKRLRDISDAQILFDEMGPASGRPSVPVSRLPWVAAAVFAAIAAGLAVLQFRAAPPPRPVARLTIPIAEATELALFPMPAVAISSDGSRVVYAATRAGRTQLYLRPIDQIEAKPIQGAEGGQGPFFSPDGQWIGFFAEGKLKKVPVAGGPALALCDAPDGRGASWGLDDTIWFAPEFSAGIWRVAASGGQPQKVTMPDPKKGERSHIWPDLLPGGKTVIFTVGLAGIVSYDEARIAAHSLDTGQQKTLLERGTYARYVPNPAGAGRLVFAREGFLLAAPFDPARLELAGSPAPVVEGVLRIAVPGTGHYAFSTPTPARSSSLVYVPGARETAERVVVWADRQGKIQPLPLPARGYVGVRMSPDGTRLALTTLSGGGQEVWLSEALRGTQTRLSAETGGGRTPVWSPDGKRLVYSSGVGGRTSIWMKLVDGGGAPERIFESESDAFATSWSPDGRYLALTQFEAQGDLWILPLDGNRKPVPFLRTRSSELFAAFSPDPRGRWLAYASNESGRYEVYVQEFPGEPFGAGRRVQVSTGGGTSPVWSRSGQELFYQIGEKLMAVSISTRPVFTPSTPRLVVETEYYGLLNEPLFDVAPDGRRFVMIRSGEKRRSPRELIFVMNWLAAK